MKRFQSCTPMPNSTYRYQYEIIKSLTSIKVFFRPRDLDKGVQPIILVRARFFDYCERRNKRYHASSLGGLWASGRLTSIFFYSVKLGPAFAFFSRSFDTGRNNGRTFISSIFRQAAHRAAAIFTSSDNFIKRCAFGNIINIPTVCSRDSFGARIRCVRESSRMAAAYGPGFCIWGDCPSFSTSAVVLFKHGVFEVPSDNFKPLLLGQIKPCFERSYG